MIRLRENTLLFWVVIWLFSSKLTNLQNKEIIKFIFNLSFVVLLPVPKKTEQIWWEGAYKGMLVVFMRLWDWSFFFVHVLEGQFPLVGYICEIRNNYSGCSDIHEAVIYAPNNLAKMLSLPCFTISICRGGYSELPENTDLEQMHHFV